MFFRFKPISVFLVNILRIFRYFLFFILSFLYKSSLFAKQVVKVFIMKLITAIVRPERVGMVKSALFEAGITGITLSKVSGHGGEKEFIEQYRGNRIIMEFQDKVSIRIGVSEAFVEVAIAAIKKSAFTGKIGDGKIFVQALEDVVRIRTGEHGNAALTPVNQKMIAPSELQKL